MSFAVLLLLERLGPTERAVFILRGVFDYGYAELAAMLDLAPAHCRQLYRRARSHLSQERRRFHPSRQAHAELTRQLLAAAAGGDLDGLQALLCEDVTVVTDGGGRVRAALRPVVGRAAVARLLLAISPSGLAAPRPRMVEVNGTPALVTTDRGRLTHVGLVQARGARAWRIFVVANPDKLKGLARQLTVRDGPATVPLTAANAGPARAGLGGG